MKGLAPFVLIIVSLVLGPALGCSAVLGLDSGSTRDSLEDGGTIDAGLPDQTSPPADATHGDGAVQPGCAAGERLCGTTCAKPDDPAFGCGAPSCQACSLPHTATTACAGGACVVAPGGCSPGFADCDKNEANGCEGDLGTTATCGQCTNKCSGTTGVCQSGQCSATCLPPTPTDCGGACVDATSNPTHCGASCLNCTVPNSTPSCTGGSCGFSCNSGYGDCNLNPGDGCETPLNTDQNCGFCKIDCTTPTAKHTTGTCSGNFCAPTQCELNWYDCDANLGDGCECMGAGCCTPTDGSTPPTDSGSCLPPGSTCNGGSSTCCGACRPGPPCAPLPLLQPGSCCALAGQMCAQASDCCNTSATCAGTCSS